jgi:hypothetical protein
MLLRMSFKKVKKIESGINRLLINKSKFDEIN